MSFKLDTQAAAQSDKPLPITQAGAYTGTLTQAWSEQSEGGAVALKFDFRRDDGAQAKGLTIWHTAKNGQPLDANQAKIMALMYCLRVRDAQKKSGKIKKYDFEQRKVIDTNADIYPDLINRKIGIALDTEEYNGKIKLVFSFAFDAETKLTAAEAINKKPASYVEGFIAQCSTKKILQPAAEAAEEKKPSIDFDDDIPF